MANYRIPGTICSTLQSCSIEDGTLALWLSPTVGSMCPIPEPFCCVPEEPDVSFLFRSCRNPVRGLSDADYAAAAKTLGIETEVIKAIAEVETKGAAFDPEGRPTILFERHKFSKYTGGKYDAKYQDISNSSSGGYGKYSAQYGRLERAYELDATAALRAASWGRFQILGDNFAQAGYLSVYWFVLAHTQSELEHLNAFVRFSQGDKTLLKALRDKAWAKIARIYNGPDYATNDYDTKMQAAYEKLTAK